MSSSSRQLTWYLLFASACALAQQPGSLTPRELAEIARQRAAEAKQQFVLPGKVEDEQKLRALADQAKSRGLEELKKQTAAYREVHPKAAHKDVGGEKPAGLVIVALSSSMPDRMIRDYLIQLDGLKGAVVVLRGFIGGATKVAPTGLWLERLARRNPSDREAGYYRVDYKVDPLVYRDLGIMQVPAVTYLPGVEDISHCDAETFRAAALVYGASSVSSSLRELRKLGAAVPEALIRKLEGLP